MKKVYAILSLFLTIGIFTSCSDDPEVVKSSLASISEFSVAIEGLTPDDIKYEGLGTENITISVPFGTSLETVIPTIKVSEKAGVSPVSNTPISFIDGETKKFIVTAEDETTKEYNVTITTRAEIGSGTKLKSFVLDYFGIYKYDFTYNEANLVSKFSVTEPESDAVESELIYNAKNQIVEKKTEVNNLSTVYSYNDAGQIISAEVKLKGKLKYSYTYEYNTEGNLLKITRKETDKEDYIQSFEYTNGNTIKSVNGSQEYVATFDDKNNPFKGIYPLAYGKILAGNTARFNEVNMNNPVTFTGADDPGVTYEYNTDNYPINYTYTVFGFQTVKGTYTYE